MTKERGQRTYGQHDARDTHHDGGDRDGGEAVDENMR